jgi:hypothetical protein
MSSIKITENFLMKEWIQMSAFLKECYREDHILCSETFFRWQFRVESNGEKANLICAWKEDKLLGIYGYLPLKVHWGNLEQPVQAVWTLYWMVKKEAPRGLGWLLIKKLNGMKLPLQLSVNVSEIGGPIFKALNWTIYSRVPRYICVLDNKQCLDMLCPGAKKSDLIDKHFKSTDHPVALKHIENESDYRPIWTLYSNLAFGTVRSFDYLRWRYINHPVFKYHIALEGEPNRPAICVYRIEQAFGNYESKVGRIVDFFYPSDERGKKEGNSLLQTVVRHLQKINCSFVEFICSNRNVSQIFIDIGAKEEPIERHLLPARLTPIQNVFRNQNIVFYRDKELDVPPLEKMYITKSDIDGDSPSSKLLYA